MFPRTVHVLNVPDLQNRTTSSESSAADVVCGPQASQVRLIGPPSFVIFVSNPETHSPLPDPSQNVSLVAPVQEVRSLRSLALYMS
jgi:hypothetical protein